MPNTSFEDRLSRLQERQEQSFRAASEKPAHRKATTRRERLTLALAHLERGGVTGAFAYAPVFRMLAAIGLGPRPLFYWSWIGLVIFGFALFTGIFGGVIYLSVQFGHVARPVQVMIEAGPDVLLVVNTVLALGFAAIHKFKAMQMGLPRWRDL
ncbi:hypothetical protein SAMN05444007_101305 [Cribrihabitans marinus]|uniref:Uncharacterized protein n=1 Tax=Cribrihabitans marinus TaxID=1227549 RepID=A0A1H6R2J5_9RHOB|nr:DUF6404 family protein [Cribrihabitans marinus]GGH19913.1 hypothetical protein GCM10010973_03510 [Cribrihabitans marinus]SEI47444.1 hypothetical protein SAMN05444007_101305 [Cribrihabitans marinus]